MTPQRVQSQCIIGEVQHSSWNLRTHIDENREDPKKNYYITNCPLSIRSSDKAWNPPHSTRSPAVYCAVNHVVCCVLEVRTTTVEVASRRQRMKINWIVVVRCRSFLRPIRDCGCLRPSVIIALMSNGVPQHRDHRKTMEHGQPTYKYCSLSGSSVIQIISKWGTRSLHNTAWLLANIMDTALIVIRGLFLLITRHKTQKQSAYIRSRQQTSTIKIPRLVATND